MSNTLSNFFTGIGAKRLSEVEISPEKSNQHEFNATLAFREIFGAERMKYSAKFILLNDNEENNIQQSGNLTWYDARENHETRTEYRFYYNSNDVIKNASVGDLMILGRTSKNSVAVIIAPKNSTSEEQLLWLFDLKTVGNKFVTRDFSEEKSELGYAGNYIIASLGFEVTKPEPDYLHQLMEKFGAKFPTTAIFSSFARSITKDVDPVGAPDVTLLKWMEQEQILFKTFESYFVKEKLKEGFGEENDDVDAFIKYSLSIQNRRKSRAGHAFENHVAEILRSNKLNFTAQPITERYNTPDFIFPGIEQYRDSDFDEGALTMLGLKTSVKERWAQILSEADRISPKHLLTLEPAISKNQTEEMIARQVQLVIPSPIIKTFLPEQQKEISSLSQFIDMIKSKNGNS